MPRVRGCDAVYEVADIWRERCLKSDSSLLWPDVAESTWAPHILQTARDAINELVAKNTNTGGHMEQRLRGEPDAIKRATADATAIWNICPGSIGVEGRKNFVRYVAGFADSSPQLDAVNEAIQANIGGKESSWFKPGFQIQRGAHLRFILELGRRIKIEQTDPDSYLNMRQLMKEIGQDYPRSSSAKNMVLHLLFPDETEPIFNNWARDRIAEAPEFAPYINEFDDLEDALASIRKAYSTELSLDEFDFYDPEIRNIWRPPDPPTKEPEISTATEPVASKQSDRPAISLLQARAFLSDAAVQEIETLLRAKKQIIFEGPPGSGKTYVARLFARYLAGVPLDTTTDEHVEIVQFHQSYGYEDFVAGIRPVTGEGGQLTYQNQPGLFVEMCKRAAARPDETFVLIIDEINRGNLSRIFGELLYGLEYRGQPVRMQYPDLLGDDGDDHLTIPDNLYLIGTMNSTDRSLAMIDYALRRRFYFWRLMPTEGNQAPVLRNWLDSQPALTQSERSWLHDGFVDLNIEIAKMLGDDYQIGHSYFMLGPGEIGDPAAHRRVWRHAVEPLLREYLHTRPNAGSAIEQLRQRFFRDAPPVSALFETIDPEA